MSITCSECGSSNVICTWFGRCFCQNCPHEWDKDEDEPRRLSLIPIMILFFVVLVGVILFVEGGKHGGR